MLCLHKGYPKLRTYRVWYQHLRGKKNFFLHIITWEYFRVPETRWKHQESKDHSFLHRSYTQKYFSAPKNNISTGWAKNVFEIIGRMLDFSKGFLIMTYKETLTKIEHPTNNFKNSFCSARRNIIFRIWKIFLGIASM